jgi:hypothetical protein
MMRWGRWGGAEARMAAWRMSVVPVFCPSRCSADGGCVVVVWRAVPIAQGHAWGSPDMGRRRRASADVGN